MKEPSDEQVSGLTPPLRIGVSACLLGHNVRFDGGHKRAPYVTDVLARFAELVPLCPEMAMGLPAPRETLRLVRRDGAVRLVTARSGRDHTEAMVAWSRRELDALLAGPPLDGFVVKKGSPSCGLERVRVYAHARPDHDGVGLFTAELMRRMPLLPIEEEGRLNDPLLRERFLVRVFARSRLRRLLAGWSPAEAVRFQSREKILLMAADPAAQKSLGRLVAAANDDGAPWAYAQGFTEALAQLPSRPRHVNALQHLAGFFKRALGREDRRELTEAIAAFAEGTATLSVPLTLLRHHARREGPAWVAAQTYLAPFPPALMPARAF